MNLAQQLTSEQEKDLKKTFSEIARIRQLEIGGSMSLNTNYLLSGCHKIHMQELTNISKFHNGFGVDLRRVLTSGLKWLTLFAVMLSLTPNLFSQPWDTNEQFAGSQDIFKAEPAVVEEDPPVAVRAQMMMFDSYGKPTWALVTGGMMLTGAVIMASYAYNNSDEDSDHISNVAPLMMGVMSAWMLSYYFLSDDIPRRAQTTKNDIPHMWDSFNLGLRRNTLQATATWEW